MHREERRLLSDDMNRNELCSLNNTTQSAVWLEPGGGLGRRDLPHEVGGAVRAFVLGDRLELHVLQQADEATLRPEAALLVAVLADPPVRSSTVSVAAQSAQADRCCVSREIEGALVLEDLACTQP